MDTQLKIGLVSVSDRASQGVYADQGIPELKQWLEQAMATPFSVVERLIPDEQAEIERVLCELVDEQHCHLVLTTGGTGPAKRDVTPDATLAIADREMPGFGEQMRQVSLHFVPTVRQPFFLKPFFQLFKSTFQMNIRNFQFAVSTCGIIAFM